MSKAGKKERERVILPPEYTCIYNFKDLKDLTFEIPLSSESRITSRTGADRSEK